MYVRNLHLFAFAVAFGGLMMAPRSCFGQKQAASVEKHSALEQEILKLNNDMLDAEVHADIPALDQFFTDDFVRLTLGGLENKANFLNALKTGRNRFLAYELSDVQIHTYGTIAIVAGGLHLKSANGDTQNLFADIWILQKGKWRTLAWSTLRPAPARGALSGDAPVQKTDTAGLDAQEQSLLKRNQEMFGAQTRADVAVLDQILTRDFCRVTAEGVRDKAGLVSDLKTGKTRFDILEPNDVKAHVYGNTALLTGGFRAKDSASDTQNLFLGVWVQEKGKWRTAAFIADAHPRPQAAPAAAR